MPDELYVYLIYLFYGMAFFAIGVAITSRDTRASKLEIARFLWLFALFGFIHGSHEWMQLYLHFISTSLSENIFPYIIIVELVLVFSSFLFLLFFGLNILRLTLPKKHHYFLPIIPFLLFLLLMSFVLINAGKVDSSFCENIDIRVRNFIGLPGAVFSGLGFIFYSRTVQYISRKGAYNFIGAGIFLVVYGILTGIVPSGTRLPMVGVPVELLRGLSAFLILHFVMHALHTFDIERKLLIEERLHRFAKAEKLHSLGKLAFGIAHEINNPLSNVSISIELLRKKLEEQGDFTPHEKRFLAIERNLTRASNIAQELLQFSTNKDTEFMSTDLNEMVSSTLELLGSRREKYQINMHFQEIPMVSAIPWKLEEVILNIIVNAMDAMPDGGSIDIETRFKDDKVVVEIADDGPGIPAEYTDSVLDPFFTTKEVGQGTGLGLSICFGIMEMHGGSIELQSEIGQGTKVILTFPQAGGNNG